MHEFNLLIEAPLEWLSFWRFELLVGLGLLGLEIIRRKHGNNKIVAAFIDMLSKAAVDQLEGQEGKAMGQTDSRRKRIKRKVRRHIAKQARKANRQTSKGQKRGDRGG